MSTNVPATPKAKFRDGAPPTPLQLPVAICPECQGKMAYSPVSEKGLHLARFFCDTCKYGYQAQLHFFNGVNIPYRDPKARGESV